MGKNRLAIEVGDYAGKIRLNYGAARLQAFGPRERPRHLSACCPKRAAGPRESGNTLDGMACIGLEASGAKSSLGEDELSG